jgi:hypothetical protein
LTPIGQRFHKFARFETISVPEFNMQIHFLHDPPNADKNGRRLSSRGALSSTTTTCCLVHKDEMYSVMTGNEWSAAAPHFGIPFGSKELCVHIELDEADARPSQYRERLISRQTGDDIVPIDWAFCVRERMPEWVKEVIRNASPRKTEDLSDLRRELQDLLNRYRVKIPGRKLDTEHGQPSAGCEGEDLGGFGMGSLESAIDGPSRQLKRRRLHEAPEGATTTTLYDVFEKAPKPIVLDDPEEIAEKGLKGRAAWFVIETGDLFVNGLYEAVDRTINDVEPEFVGHADSEVIRRISTSAARRALALRVGKATVFALAKRVNEDWTQRDMQAALTKESLSIAADNYEESLSVVRKNIREGIKLEKVAA